MLRTSCLALMLALTVAACGSDDTPTTPSTANTAPKFTATLSPANEVPAVSNADASGSGVATITLNLTKDSAGNITAATADFQVNMTGFPAGTTLTGAHIHPGASGTTGGVVWNSTIASGDVVLANGAGSFSRSNLSATDAATLAQAIINNPAGYYFNIHTTINGGGAARGQLVRSN